MKVSIAIKASLLTLIFAFTASVSAETITLANGEWAPYMSQKLKKYGFVSDIVVQAFKAEGINVKWVFLPWKRGFEGAKSGQYAGSAIWGYNKNRAKYFLFSNPVLNLKTVFFIKKGSNFSYNTVSDLKDKKLGGVIGYAYGIENAEKAGIVKIDRIGNPDNNYRKLIAGRLDAVLEDSQVGLAAIHKLGYDGKIIPYKKPLKSRKYSVIISKKIPNGQHLIDAFNKGLKKLKDSGKFAAILKAARQGAYK